MNISTSAVLVSPGLAVKGTMSITASEVYFEVDEDNADYKKLEPQVRLNFFVDLIRSTNVLNTEAYSNCTFFF